MDDQPLTSASPNVIEDKTPPRKRHGCFYYGCLTSIVLSILAAGGFFALYQYAKSSVTPVVEEFLTAVEGENYDHAYSMIADDWKRTTSREDFPAMFEHLRDALGARRSLWLRGVFLQTTTAGTFARADYGAVYDEDTVELTFTLKKSAGQWQIAGANFNSPKINASLKCPNCGAANTFDAEFCAKCGKPLHQ